MSSQRILVVDDEKSIREFLTILLLSLAVSGFLAFFMERLPGVPLSESLRQAPLLAFSAQTTAGFSPLDTSSLDNPSKVLLMISMFELLNSWLHKAGQLSRAPRL